MLVFALLPSCLEYGVQGGDSKVEGATLSVDPPHLDFGQLAPGTQMELEFTVLNEGPVGVQLDETFLVGGAFALGTDVQGTLLDADETLDVVVHYTATSPDDAGVAHVLSDALNADLPVTLWGGALRGVLEVTPSLLEYESLDGVPLVEAVTVANVGTAPLVVDALVSTEAAFTVDEELPFALGPGEEATVEVTFAPPHPGTLEGELWVGSDVGDAQVDLKGEWFQCVPLQEAWSKGQVTMTYTGSSHVVENDGEDDVCVENWHIFLTTVSQDAAVGDPILADEGAVLRILPGGTLTFDYLDQVEPAWACVEQTQVVRPTSSFEFFGAQVPPMVLEHVLRLSDPGQTDVWETIADSAIPILGYTDAAHDLEVGETAQFEIRVLDLGRQPTVATVYETVPAHLSVTGFTVEPDLAVPNDDGSTTYAWTMALAGAIDTDIDTHTIYDDHFIAYTARLEECPSPRNEGPPPEAEWYWGGAMQRSQGSAAVVNCTP